MQIQVFIKIKWKGYRRPIRLISESDFLKEEKIRIEKEKETEENTSKEEKVIPIKKKLKQKKEKILNKNWGEEDLIKKWKWFDERTNQWTDMMEKISTDLEQTKKDNKTEYIFQAGQSEFKIDLIKMVQITVKSPNINAINFERKIKYVSNKDLFDNKEEVEEEEDEDEKKE
jgi:hypothetical protein